jgi:ankyrin repeat protein
MGASTEIFEAVKANDLSRLAGLLETDPSLASARDENGVTPVLVARYYGRMDALPALVAAKPELDIFEAAAVGDEARVRTLLAADLSLADAYSPDGFPVLGLAVFFGHPAIASLLIEHGADVNARSRNAMEVQPLHSAVAANDEASTRLLLEHGADVNSAQRDAYTPLHESAQNGNLAITELLLAHGADRSARLSDGRTPLDLAVAHGHPAVVLRLRPA